jgi:beta-lactamase regulating signal transducer with metallopeptidase domain
MQLAAFIPIVTEALRGSMSHAGDAPLTNWRAFSQQAAPIAVTAVWQGAVVACGLAICLRLAPRTSAEHRFAVWAAAFVSLVSLPLVSRFPDFVSRFADFSSAAVGGVSSAARTATVGGPWLQLDIRWSMAICALWAVATLVRAGDLAVHSLRLRKLWKDAVPVELGGRFTESAAGLWSRGRVEICTTTTLQRPSVIGFLKPRILIPDWLFRKLTPGELEQIVLHESEHLRRRDDWTNLFQKVCLVLFPLNPALVWIERRLCREREMACDDGVIRVTHAPRAYAACLASLAERGLERRAEALSLGAWQRRPELVGRVHSILRRKHTLGTLGTRALLGTLGCGLLVGSIELARCPQLIAFVPERNVDASLATAPVDLQIPAARMINTSYHVSDTPARLPDFRRATAGVSTPLGARNARNSAQDDSPFLNAKIGHATLVRDAVKAEAPIESRAAFAEAASGSVRPEMLKAEMQGQRPVAGQEQQGQQQQQWIVLTTWEQVQTSNQNAGNQNAGYRNSGLTADYETDTNATTDGTTNGTANGTGSANVQHGRLPVNQITVTQFIFRIIPASTSSSQPAAVPWRDGWFVIQL